MQRLQFALFQMDEGKQHLVKGSVPALRVALLLLDNAAEVLLDRWIAHDLALDGLSERLQRRIHELGIPEDHSALADLLQHRFLTHDEKRRVSRYFDEKIRYVTETKKVLSPSVGAVLSHLHRYRNEAYHSGRVKPQILRTSVMIHLELCCQLTMALKPSGGYSSSDDFSWLEERFGLRPHDLWDDAKMVSLISAFRGGLAIADSSIGGTLALNLECRIIEVNEALDFICGESRDHVDRGKALAYAQGFALEEIKNEPPYRSVPRDVSRPLSLEHLSELVLFPNLIRAAPNPVEGFEIYAEADPLLERIEFVVSRLAGAIDEAIELQIDAARGK